LSTVRIYKVAQLLGLSSQEAIVLLKKETGIEVKSASGSVEEIVARQFVEKQAKARRIQLPPPSKMFEDAPAAPAKKGGAAKPKASEDDGLPFDDDLDDLISVTDDAPKDDLDALMDKLDDLDL